jgi:hypothetical protein
MDKNNLPPWFPLIDDKLKSVPACIRQEIMETIVKTKQMEDAIFAIIGSMPEHKIVVKLSDARNNIAKYAREHGDRIGVSFTVEDDDDTVTIGLEPPPKPNNIIPFIRS